MSTQPVPLTPEAPRRAERVATTFAILLDDREIHIPASALTHEGFRAWATSDDFPERARISFIDQEILIDMSPEETETHSKVKGEISWGIQDLNKKLDLGEFYPDGTLITNVAAGLSTEPDGTFITWESWEAGRVVLVPRKDFPGEFMEIQGTPDWALEIISRSSVGKDTKRLRQAYHRAAVPEYWLINAFKADIDFQILHYTPADYVAAARRGGWQRSKVFGRSFRLDRWRGRFDRWKYTLQVKPPPQ
jgi:Uma2 family endonuclease